SLTQVETGKRLRISTAWVRELTNRGILDRNEDGSYPWPRVADQYREYQEEPEEPKPERNGDGSASVLAAEELRERIRWTRERADKQEMENAVRRGELIPAEHYREALRRPLEACDLALRNAKRRIGKKWAKRLDTSEAEAMALIEEIAEDARRHIREALEDDDDPPA
ncbi:MAG: hypothetical protein ACOC9T_00220, partial [Myxococcota bacterium]